MVERSALIIAERSLRASTRDAGPLRRGLTICDRAIGTKRGLSPTLSKAGLATDMPHCLNLEVQSHL
jgi:hypothetical protein